MMAEANAVSQYPAPPHFYELYRGGASAGPPPPPPVEGDIVVFGAPFSLVRDERRGDDPACVSTVSCNLVVFVTCRQQHRA